ncbi:hypothetical protein HDU79_007772 [Rhizoclosmatium sp. JEL0117]|nr:hypothetical protein HDU79_007772 [Rhizoclosmatium sp. JEL0117]
MHHRWFRQEYVIVVSDTIPHARGLLLSLLETNSAKECTSKVILEITNRFDYALSSKRDIKLYYQLFRRLAELTQRSDSLFWVANNNFERAYMEYRLGVSLPFVQVLRPLGITGDDSDYSYPTDLPAPNRSMLVALNHSNTNVFKLAQNSYSVPLATVAQSPA